MGIQRSEVEKVATLSRIALRDDQIDLFADQLSRILNYVNQLNQLDTADVEPLSHALPVANVFREDVPQASLTAAEALGNAPARTAAGFKVPRVLDDGGSS